MSVTAPPAQQPPPPAPPPPAPPASDHALLAAIVLVLAADATAALTAGLLSVLLAPIGAGATAITAVLALLGPTGHPPAGRAAQFTHAAESAYRAAYLLAAVRRLSTGGTLADEQRYAGQHLAAQKARAGAAAAVDATVGRTGTVTLTWRARMDSRTSDGCRTVDGTVFRVDAPPVVEGRRCYPGQVHVYCRCVAEPGTSGVRLVKAFDPGELRDFHGRWARVGFHVASGEERKALRVPPAAADAHVPNRPGRIVAVWRDAKGREQRRYSDEHTAQAASAKFERVRKQLPHLEAARAKLLDAANQGNDHSAAALLIHEMGLRPGSEHDTGAKVKAYGATNLRVEHVTVDGNHVHLSFTGKKGVRIQLTQHNPALAGVLRSRLAGKGPHGRMFATTESQTRAALHEALPGAKLKDLRTLRARTVALKAMRSMPVPATPAQFKAQRLQVARRVASQLGNTPTVALASYIDPAVFDAWRRSAGI